MSLHTKFAIDEIEESQLRMMKIKDNKYTPPRAHKSPQDKVQSKIKKRIEQLKKFNQALVDGATLSSIKSEDFQKHNMSVASTKVEFSTLGEYLKETHPLFFSQSADLCQDVSSNGTLLKVQAK